MPHFTFEKSADEQSVVVRYFATDDEHDAVFEHKYTTEEWADVIANTQS